METLETIKNNYAKEHAYKDWKELQEYHKYNPRGMESHMNEICIRSQKAALEKAAERAIALYDIDFLADVNKESITNEENLIR